MRIRGRIRVRDDPPFIVLAKECGMKPASLTTLCKKYLALKDQADELNAKLKPINDQAKDLQSQVLEQMQSEKLSVFQKGKLTAALEEKANSVSWAGECLKALGPEKITAIKQVAGTSTTVKISQQK